MSNRASCKTMRRLRSQECLGQIHWGGVRRHGAAGERLYFLVAIGGVCFLNVWSLKNLFERIGKDMGICKERLCLD